ELSFGGQACARATVAKRLRHRGDHADFTAAVDIAPTLRHFAGIVRADGFERHFGIDAADHFGRGDHVVHAPAVGGADVHEFDEAYDMAAAFEMPRHVDDRMIVDAALYHHVHLERGEPRTCGGVDAFQHFRHRKLHVVH